MGLKEKSPQAVENEAKPLPKNAGGILYARTRYIILLLGSACIASIASNMTVINFTHVCMSEPKNRNNSEDVALAAKMTYSQRDMSIINWSMAIGTLLVAWPFHWFYEKFGARKVFFVAGVISTISVAVMPTAANFHLYAVCVVRFFQGISFGADFAAIGLIVVHWASLKQHGLFISFLSSFSQISVMFTMPLSGFMCSFASWELSYYIHAAVSGSLFIAWYIFYRDDPVKHPKMTEVELEKIHRNKDAAELDATEATPIWEIMKDPVVWTIWLSAFGELLMSQFIVMYGASYFAEGLGISTHNTGLFVALPRFVHLCFKIISGILSDKIKFWTEKTKMIIFNTIALKMSGIFFLIIGFVPREYATWAIVCLFIIETTTGCICGGFYKCATLVARQHSHFVLSQIQFIKCLSLFIEPGLVLLFCPNKTLVEWRTVFIIHGLLLITGNIVFCIFATDKPRPFTHLKSAATESGSDSEKARLTPEKH